MKRNRNRPLFNANPNATKDPTGRQYGLLRELADAGVVRASAGTDYNMTTFKSMLYWGWVQLNDGPRVGWKITEKGRKAIRDHENAEYRRKNNTHQYSPVIQGLSASLQGKYEEHKNRVPAGKQPISIAARRRIAS